MILFIGVKPMAWTMNQLIERAWWFICNWNLWNPSELFFAKRSLFENTWRLDRLVERLVVVVNVGGWPSNESVFCSFCLHCQVSSRSSDHAFDLTTKERTRVVKQEKWDWKTSLSTQDITRATLAPLSFHSNEGRSFVQHQEKGWEIPKFQLEVQSELSRWPTMFGTRSEPTYPFRWSC